ncbi:MAG TPA: tRNA pseudouridine(54/55) synthase Pus10 [Thermoplasmata archaeon]|nr:tRNA pseudouridine(54/55) synthase Pus10 [Thermoplasmata archaeon]
MPEPATFEITEPIRAAARRAAPRGFCPECFGRLFGRWGHGLSNPERASRLAADLGGAIAAPVDPCPLCGGTFARIPVWADRCVRAAEGHEWHRFTCGSRWDPERLAVEESFWGETGTEWGESARSAFNRELGKLLEARTGAAGGPERPDMVFLADLPVGRVDVTVMPLYLQGRYRKLDRTLPQTRWPCRRCLGHGCPACGGTGKTYPTSVEELVGAPFVRAAGAEGTRFHGMGREDIDARMLGRGRPFVLELLRPRVRTLDVAGLAAALGPDAAGRVEVLDLRPALAEDVVRVKEASPEKSYRVGVVGSAAVEKVNEALRLATGRAIAQRTPRRVAHRRSDLVRERRIVAARLVEGAEGRFTLDVRTEAGTYVKEWVEGDEGRTDPSLASLVGVPLKVEYLDVLEIHDPEA